MENKTAEEILKRTTMPNISVNAQFDAILSAMEAYAEQYKSKWIPVVDGEPMGTDDDNMVVLFDNGETRLYDDPWPFAEATKYFILPPTQ